MKEFLGKHVSITSNNKVFKGVLYNANDTHIEIKTSRNNVKLSINDIQNMEIECEENKTAKKDVLDEKEMYSLFYDSFNFYGPTEDQFILYVCNALHKTVKDAKNIKIIVGSDDIFGQIGLCFARMIIRTGKNVFVNVRTPLMSLNSSKHYQLLKNNHQENLKLVEYAEEDENSCIYETVLIAANRNALERISFAYSDEIRYMIVDCASKNEFTNYFAFGLGFIPDTYKNYKNNFFIVDVGFSSELCNKHGIDDKFTASIRKVKIN